MRIIAGEYKGRVVESPSERTTRPTTDRVRESIFSAIYSRLPELEGVSVLDAFAGSGALGIEALSRGAARCVFVERDKDARAVLEKNLAALKIDRTRSRVMQADSFALVSTKAAGTERFGLVLLDPPYAYEPHEIRALLDDLAAARRLADGCVVVYEHALDNRDAVVEEFASADRFVVDAHKKYGKIGVTFLKYNDSEE